MHNEKYKEQTYEHLSKPGEYVNHFIRVFDSINGRLPSQMIYFDSPRELVECVEANKDIWDDKDHGLKKFNPSSEHNWTFGKDFKTLGATTEAILSGAIPDNLVKDVDKFTVKLYDDHPELFEIEQNAMRIKRKRVFKESGDELNIDRYMSGDLEMWEKMSKRPVKQSMKIMINSCLHCGHSADKFTKGMIMLTAFLDILDKAGISSEVWYAPIGEGTTDSLHLSGVFAKIKSADEPIDIFKILSCGAPGLFRHYTFKVWCNLLKGKPTYGLGSMVDNKNSLEYVKEINGFDVMINANDTAKETFNIITNKLKELF